MGKIPMKCPKCGQIDINDFIIHYKVKQKQVPENYLDATTLPKFLWYLKQGKIPHLKGRIPELGMFMHDTKLVPFDKITIDYITCDKCFTTVKPTRYGI